MVNLSSEQRFKVKFKVQRPKVGVHSGLCSFSWYLLSTFYVPGAVLGSGIQQ